jgi:hypothetical protein
MFETIGVSSVFSLSLVGCTCAPFVLVHECTLPLLDTRLRGYDGYFVIPAEAGIQEKCNLCLPRSVVSRGTCAVYALIWDSHGNSMRCAHEINAIAVRAHAAFPALSGDLEN